MTAPATVSSGSEDIPLAQVKDIGTSEILAIIGMVAGVLTAAFGSDFGVAKNAQVIAEVAVFLIPMVTAHARAKKHGAVAHANALVTVAQIQAATQALIAAQTNAAPGAPTPDSATATAATAAAPPTVAYGYDGARPASGKHAAAEVGADLPVVDLTSEAGNVPADVTIMLLVITAGVFLGGLLLHFVLT